MYKRVKIQVIVPEGEYCLQLDGDKTECEHLSYEDNGSYSCDIFYIAKLIEIKDKGVKKSPECLTAQVVIDEENKILRELLWLRHGCDVIGLYGDDGEKQCGICMIDFKRDSPQLIKEKWEKIGKGKLEKFLMEEEKK